MAAPPAFARNENAASSPVGTAPPLHVTVVLRTVRLQPGAGRKESIENPDAYVVPGFSKGVMPPFQGKLTDSQINDLVKFLTNP